MKINKIAVAGTLESSDISITIEPKESLGIEIMLKSSVEKQFGSQIKKVIEDTLKESGVDSALVKVVDKGAIDYVIKSRTQTAIFRAADVEKYSWESVK